MPKPWEKYQTSKKPWEKYSAQQKGFVGTEQNNLQQDINRLLGFTNQQIANALGAPVDLMNTIIGVDKPFLGSKDIAEKFKSVGIGVSDREAETLAERMAGGVGFGVGNLLPFMGASKALSVGKGVVGGAAKELLDAMVSTPGKTLTSEILGGLGMGAGGSITDNPTGKVLGEVGGAVLGGGLPYLFKNSTKAIQSASKETFEKLNRIAAQASDDPVLYRKLKSLDLESVFNSPEAINKIDDIEKIIKTKEFIGADRAKKQKMLDDVFNPKDLQAQQERLQRQAIEKSGKENLTKAQNELERQARFAQAEQELAKRKAEIAAREVNPQTKRLKAPADREMQGEGVLQKEAEIAASQKKINETKKISKRGQDKLKVTTGKPLAEAEFLGMQKRADGSEFPLFNIVNKDHPKYGSTVGLKTLEQENIKVPKYPEPKKSILSTTKTVNDIKYTTNKIGENEIVIGEFTKGKNAGKKFVDEVKIKKDNGYSWASDWNKIMKKTLEEHPNITGQTSNETAVRINHRAGMRAFDKNGKELSLEETIQKMKDQTSVKMELPKKPVAKVESFSKSKTGSLNLTKSQRSSLEIVREEIQAGEAGSRVPINDVRGIDTYKGLSSTFPKYFQNKGYTKEESLNAINKALEGKPLTEKQKLLVEDLNQAKRESLTGEIVGSRKTGETSADKLDVGDTFKRNGETYTVKDVNEDGKIKLSNSEEFYMWGDDALKYDRGTLKKNVVSETKEYTELKKTYKEKLNMFDYDNKLEVSKALKVDINAVDLPYEKWNTLYTIYKRSGKDQALKYLNKNKPSLEKQFIEQQAKLGNDATKKQTMQTKLANREKMQEKLAKDKSKGQEDLFVKADGEKQTDIFQSPKDLNSLVGKQIKSGSVTGEVVEDLGAKLKVKTATGEVIVPKGSNVKEQTLFGYAKGAAKAISKDMADPTSLGSTFGGEYKNLQEFFKNTNLKLSETDKKVLIQGVSKIINSKAVETAEKRTARIESFLKDFKPIRAKEITEGKIVDPSGLNVSDLTKQGMPRKDAIDIIYGPVKKVTEALNKVKPLRRKQEAIYFKERSKRAGALTEIGSKMDGEEGYFNKLRSLKGEYSKVDFESIRSQIKQEDVDGLFNMVEESRLLPFEKISAGRGLAKILGAEGGSLPTRSELELLREVFPEEMIKSVLDKRSLLAKFWGGTKDALNLPRALMASVDLSAPLRQGIFLIGKQKQFAPAFKEMFKYAFSERAYKNLLSDIHSRPTYKAMREANLAITKVGVKDLSVREETFMSNLAERIPGIGAVVRGSGRAYTGFLDKLRADVFDDLYNKAGNLGLLKERPEIVKNLGKFINSATGRGSLGKLERSAETLNGIFFSPRLLASRLNLINPVYYTKLDPYVRKEALKSLLTFAGTGLTILSLAKAGGAEVSLDPTNADFGKIKIGNTRYDIFGGFQQYLVLGARLIVGKITSSTTGKEMVFGEGYKPANRLDAITRFFEFKESPVASFVTGLVRGETATGKKFDVPSEVVDRFIPMLAQDIYDIYKEKGAKGIPQVLPSVFGVGSQTYGELIPKKNITPSGKETVQFRQEPTLGEAIVRGTKSDFTPKETKELQDERNKKIKKELNIQKARKRVEETGVTERVEGKKIYMKDGVVIIENIKSRRRRAR